LPCKQPPRPVNWRQIPEKPVDQGAEQFPGHFRGGAQCLFQKHQREGQRFCEGRLLEFFATSVKQGPKSSGVLVGPLGEGQHDVSAAHHSGMGDKSVIGSTLALFGKIEKRLGHLEEHRCPICAYRP